MMAAMLMKAWPYLLALAIGTSLGVWTRGFKADQDLAHEQQAHAQDVQRLTQQLDAGTAAAAMATQKALAEHAAQETRIAALDAKLTQEVRTHEADARAYQSDLARGTQRLRVAVAHCTTSRNDVSAAANAPGVGDGTPTYADLDAAVASRVFGVANDDQREIDKLKVMQGYACAVRPDLPACAH
jgi:prophage endopeptidase